MEMPEYHKILTIWERDEHAPGRPVIPGQWATPEFSYLQNSVWVWTEKLDGTNIRVMWDGERVRFGGRTGRAMIDARLVDHLQRIFTDSRCREAFSGPICLYGEGVGVGIQKGGERYCPDGVKFVLFDAWADVWLTRESVEALGLAFLIPIAPIVGRGTLWEAVECVQEGLCSAYGDFPFEGLVMRPRVELCDRMGRRVIAKLKVRDFPVKKEGE